MPEGLHQPEDLLHGPADVTPVVHHVHHSPCPVNDEGGPVAPMSLARPMFMERERSLSVKMEKPTGQQKPATRDIIALLTS